MESLSKSATVGATAAAASYFMRPNAQINVTILGTSLPLWVATGIAVGAGSYASALTHDLIFPALHIDERWRDVGANGVALATTAAGNYGALYAMNSGAPGQIGLMQVAGFAIGAEIAGTYFYNLFVKPMAINEYYKQYILIYRMKTPLIASTITTIITLYVLRGQNTQTQIGLSAAVGLGSYVVRLESYPTVSHVDRTSR